MEQNTQKQAARKKHRGLRLLLVHIVIWALLAAALLIGIFKWLHAYTLHDEALTVPDFSGLREAEAAVLAEENNMRYEIIDSVYVSNTLPGAVVLQQPAVGALVKRNRTIFLTINALHAEMVSMPNLVGLSLRQASSLLVMHGLRLGQFTYQRDIAYNNVLRQRYGGRDVSTGRKLPKGAVIDLVLGSGIQSDQTRIPRLTGVTLQVVRDSLLYRSLNVGELHFDATVQTTSDTLAAVVYRQEPAYSPVPEENTALIGAVVNFWLTTDVQKVAEEEKKQAEERRNRQLQQLQAESQF